VATFVGDLLIHPSHFGGVIGEALATAIGSGLLATVCLRASKHFEN